MKKKTEKKKRNLYNFFFLNVFPETCRAHYIWCLRFYCLYILRQPPQKLNEKQKNIALLTLTKNGKKRLKNIRQIQAMFFCQIKCNFASKFSAINS
jgi:hypothetical protein